MRDHSPARRAVNAALLLALAVLPACARTVRPAPWVLQSSGWSLPESLRTYDPPCNADGFTPRWELLAAGERYGNGDFAFLGTGDGTLDLAPRGFHPGASIYGVGAMPGGQRLTGVTTPLGAEAAAGGESLTFVRLYIRGGGTIDAQWVLRDGTEAAGIDLLGKPFRVPDDTNTLAQGRQAVAGVGAGRVGLHLEDKLGASRIDYGLNARVKSEQEAAEALLGHGVLRIPLEDLRTVNLRGRRLFGIPAMFGRLLRGAPIKHAFTVPAALLVSMKAILLAPVSRPIAGARAVGSGDYGAPAVGESGYEDGMLSVMLRPPEGSEVLQVLPAGGVRLEWFGDGRDRVAESVAGNGTPLTGPSLIDPGEGRRFYFENRDLPSNFRLVVDELRTLDGTEGGPWVYNMERRKRIRWNPVSVWREWRCE